MTLIVTAVRVSKLLSVVCLRQNVIIGVVQQTTSFVLSDVLEIVTDTTGLKRIQELLEFKLLRRLVGLVF